MLTIIIIIPSSHSINAIGPAPLRSGNKRERCSRMLATIAHIPCLNQLLSNAPKYHLPHPSTTPNIIGTQRNNLVDASVKDHTLRNLSAMNCMLAD
jgi:hypothetical protein